MKRMRDVVLSMVAGIAATLFFQVPSHAQGGFQTDSLFAPSLGRMTTFRIILPAHSNGRLPVILYLLHGYDGSEKDWTDRTAVQEYVRDMPLIVVMPNGNNAWYVNQAADTSLRYEEFIIHDLREYVERRYPADSTRRAIAGLSMGGAGALALGLAHPELYRFCASFSGAFVYPTFLDDTLAQPVRGPIRASLLAAFGSPGSVQRTTHDVFALAAEASVSGGAYVYLAAGIQDGFKSFLPMHRRLAAELSARGYPYEYHETPGGHNWKYWDNELKKMLPRLREVLGY